MNVAALSGLFYAASALVSAKKMILIGLVAAALGALAWRVGAFGFSARRISPRHHAYAARVYHTHAPDWVKTCVATMATPAPDVAVHDTAADCAAEPEVRAQSKMSQFEEIGHAAFRDILTSHGGNSACVQANVRLPSIRNPETGMRLDLGSLYEEGGHRIAVDYQGVQHSMFPNPFHGTIRDFNAQIQRDIAKADAARREGIYLITVPYHVDRCMPDEGASSGWRLDETLTREERRSRIEKYLKVALTEYYRAIVAQS
jgi:hypothetical protein